MEADALQHRLAPLPRAGWKGAARRTVSKRGSLDPVWWLQLAQNMTPRDEHKPVDIRDVQRIVNFANSVRREASPGTRRSAMTRGKPEGEAVRPLGTACIACGSVLGLGAVCRCQSSENAGRYDN
jgi:hypothetical protein